MYHKLVAINITDESKYSQYREKMLPLLTKIGGAFLHDFTVSDTLKTSVEHPVNRVFVITFPDKNASESFFSDWDYLMVREEYFESAVDGASILAEWDL